MRLISRLSMLICLTLALAACGGGETGDAGGGEKSDELKVDKGVDLENKVIKIGTLNDESGVAAAIGKPYALGKRILAKHVNAGGSGMLPEGWTVELVEKDHGYNPQQSVQSYNAIKEDVLFIGTSFGTPNTLPLVPMLLRDQLIAFPASLSSKMAQNEYTPPLGPAYTLEAKRALDWAVEHAGGADKVKAGIVFQKDDYGGDGLKGWQEQAKALGVGLVAQQSVAPGQSDMAAVITALKDAGANYVLITTLPSATGPILGTAAQLQYMPVWIGNTPAWVDAFFGHEKLPPAVFGNFYWVTGFPYWGEPVPGMDTFLKAFQTHGGGANPDFYVMMSYLQGVIQLEVAKRAIEQGNITRAGYRKAMHTVKDWNAGGLLQPVNLQSVPYVTGTKTRVLKPVMENKTWTVVADWADAKAPAAPAGEGGTQ